jgi:predicted O-methyltransferase YrrM
MDNYRFIIRYLTYISRAQNRFDVHSPFLYQLITEVLKGKVKNQDYFRIENLKRKLLRDQQKVEVTDLGAGSRSLSGNVRKVGRIVKNSSKPKKYGRLLYRLARHLKPDTILELGTSLGLGSAYLALGNPDAKVITIEGCPNLSAIARENFRKLSLENIKLLNGSFDELLPGVLKQISRLDLAFIDGNHLKEPTIRYFEQCLPRTSCDSILVFDDIHWSDSMESAWEYICNHPSVMLSVDLFYMGLVFFKKELTKQHFVIRY